MESVSPEGTCETGRVVQAIFLAPWEVEAKGALIQSMSGLQDQPGWLITIADFFVFVFVFPYQRAGE